MEELLRQLLQEVRELRQMQANLDRKIDDRFEAFESRARECSNKIERKVDAVYEETASLVEFRTEVSQRLEDIEQKK